MANPERRAAAAAKLRVFCETYGSNVFNLGWGQHHLVELDRMEDAIRNGGLFAVADPRGDGKTTRCEWAALYALANGLRSFLVIIGASETDSEERLDNLKSELESNDLLLEDYPEVCFPIRALEGITARSNGQTCEGARTRIEWGAKQIVLPSVPGSAASGAIVKVAGITGRIRGMNFKRPDGTSVRPDFVICDDPQTDEALDISTPIPTPRGFVRMGDLRVGDTVFDERGRPCNVIGTSDVMEGRECLRVGFDDNSHIVADAGHLWLTSTALQRTNKRRKHVVENHRYAKLPQCRSRPFASVRTTQQIRESLYSGKDSRSNHSVPLAEPLQCADPPLPVSPYTLGYWLGDGDTSGGRITTADAEVLAEIEGEGWRCTPWRAGWDWHRKRPSKAGCVTVYGLRRTLREAGLLGNKHLPGCYWFASREVRLAVLQGLMDSDGSISPGSKGVKGTRCTFTNTNTHLIRAVRHLCASLGIKTRVAATRNAKPRAQVCWTVTFITTVPVFRLPRKARRIPTRTKKSVQHRYIQSVERVATRPVRCIAVDSPSRLYLAGHGLVPTHNSANSVTQSRSRESILSGAILGLAGPGKEISGFMPCTVIQPGDMADRILDPKLHPEWKGMRTSMVKAWPRRMDLWDKYIELRKDSQRAGGKGEEAVAFYAENRAAMDEGAELSWESRKKPGDLSALQHAMDNLCDRGREVFMAEYQNNPLPKQGLPSADYKPEDLMQRLNGVDQGRVPVWASQLTVFVDVQHSSLWWALCAWGDGFTGAVVDYGVWPEQGAREYVSKRDIRRTLARAYPNTAGKEGAIYAGLDDLSAKLLDREWERQDGTAMRINRLLVDASDGNVDETIMRWCRETRHAATVLPSRGKGIGPAGVPMNQYVRKPGEQIGTNWILRRGTRHAVRHVTVDTNWWKTFLAGRLQVGKGDKGALLFYGRDAARHRMLAEHLCAETAVETEAAGRRVNVWKLTPGRDNELLDCLVGCAVAASLGGAQLSMGGAGGSGEPARMGGRRKIKLSEWKRGKR